MGILEYVKTLETLLKAHKNPQRAKAQAKYLRNQFEFIGLTHPELKNLIKLHWKQYGFPEMRDVEEFTKLCFASPYREMHHAAIRVHEKLQKSYPSDFIQIFQWMITHQSWWDSVDYLSKLCGIHFKKYPEQKKQITSAWNESDNLWLIRVSIIFQLLYKEETDFELMKTYILRHAESTEFFIQKAAGWALRNYSRIEPEYVKSFVNQHSLPKLTQREAIRLLKTQ